MKSKLLTKLLLLLPFVELFSAYSFFNIGDFSITPAVLLACIIFVIMLIMFFLNKLLLTKKSLIVYLLFIIALISSVITNINIGVGFKSAALYTFFATFYLLIFNMKHVLFDTSRYIKKYLYFLTALSVLGIIQFLLQFTSIGYIDFVIDGFMKPGFNTTNILTFNGLSFYRAHSIYAEPSFFSLYSAIGIIISFCLYKTKRLTGFETGFFVIINFIGILFSVAGSGLLLLCAFFLFYLIRNAIKNKRIWGLFSFVVISISCFMILSLSSDAFRVLFSERLLEIFHPNTSGFVRFVLPYYMGVVSVFRNPFGCGPSNTQLVNNLTGLDMPYFNNIIGDVNSSYGKALIELGYIGLIIFCMICVYLYKHSNDLTSKSFAVIFIIQGFLGGNLLDFGSLSLVSLCLLLSTRKEKIVVENGCYNNIVNVEKIGVR